MLLYLFFDYWLCISQKKNGNWKMAQGCRLSPTVETILFNSRFSKKVFFLSKLMLTFWEQTKNMHYGLCMKKNFLCLYFTKNTLYKDTMGHWDPECTLRVKDNCEIPFCSSNFLPGLGSGFYFKFLYREVMPYILKIPTKCVFPQRFCRDQNPDEDQDQHFTFEFSAKTTFYT